MEHPRSSWPESESPAKTAESFEHMYRDPDFGIDFLFRTLADRARSLPAERAARLKQKLNGILSLLRTWCRNRHHATETTEAENERKEFIEGFRGKISKLTGVGYAGKPVPGYPLYPEKITKLFYHLREIFHLSWESGQIGTLPNGDLSVFMSKVLDDWVKSAKSKKTDIDAIEAITKSPNVPAEISKNDIERLLDYCVAAVSLRRFTDWVVESNVAGNTDKFVQQHVALWFANQFPLRCNRGPHPTVEETEQRAKVAVAPEVHTLVPAFLAGLPQIARGGVILAPDARTSEYMGRMGKLKTNMDAIEKIQDFVNNPNQATIA